jgi:hypothetical protein
MFLNSQVAFCFSGQLRDLDKTISQWRDLQERHAAMVYGSFWEPTTREEENHAKLFDSLSPAEVEYEPFSKFKPFIRSFYSEMLVPTTERVNWRLSPGVGSDWIYEGSILSMWYRIWKAQMIAQDSNANLWMRLRTDTTLKNFELEQNSNLNLPWGWRMNTHWSDCGGPIDMLAWGGKEVMTFYSSTFLYLSRLLSQGHYFFPAEHVLKAHLSARNVPLKFWPMEIHLTRSPDSSFNQSGGQPVLCNNSSEWRECQLDPNFSFFVPSLNLDSPD